MTTTTSTTSRRSYAQDLLNRAAVIYDDHNLPFARMAAEQSWRQGFVSGASWMHAVMEYVRGATVPPVRVDYQRLGIVKYGLASLGASIWLAFCILIEFWPLTVGVIPVFYAIEAQMVFLFPLSIDGSPSRYVDSLLWTRRAGGTVAVMLTVLRLAVVMLFGGFAGHGYIRSWALGCLAVVLWHEDLHCA